VPPLPEQQRIAHILGTLDDKIELNRRMNATLEAMARALFKSWFVDFDPVRAKAEGRQPDGIDADTAALFPNFFEDSALGPIPAGWRVGTLSEMVEVLSGGTPKTSVDAYWNGEIPWYSVKDVPNETDIFVIDTEKHITQLGVKNSATKILPVHTTIISARGTVGKLAVTAVPMAMNQSCYGLRGKGYPDYFTFFGVRQTVAELQRNTHGTVFDTITRETFDQTYTILPPPEIACAFENSVQGLLERIANNLYESRTLAATRDAMLPRLMSGEVEV
jgi:type I restriction enzyme S subunit